MIIYLDFYREPQQLMNLIKLSIHEKGPILNTPAFPGTAPFVPAFPTLEGVDFEVTFSSVLRRGNPTIDLSPNLVVVEGSMVELGLLLNRNDLSHFAILFSNS